MKKIVSTFTFPFIALALALVAGCRREDWREVTLDVPGLKPEVEKTVRDALGKYEGVDKGSLRFDFSAKTLHLKYDSMKVARTNFRAAIADKGIETVFPTNTTGRAGY